MNSAETNIVLSKEDSVATLLMNRPGKKNALTLQMWQDITHVIDNVEHDQQIKVLIVRGIDQTSFSAGADISEFKTLRSTPEGAANYNVILERAVKKLADLQKPTIAMVQGFCIGGGCELSIACDLRFSDTTGKFGITPAKLGLVYNFGSTKQLLNLVGPSKTKDLLFSGRMIEAEEALRIGLIDRILKSQEIEQQTIQYAKQLAANSQTTIRGVKNIVQCVLNGMLQEDDHIKASILSSYQSEDYKEGVTAFLEKRKPNFK